MPKLLSISSRAVYIVGGYYMRLFQVAFAAIAVVAAVNSLALAAECVGQNLEFGSQTGLLLDDGGLAAWGKLNINIDGSARAYHPGNRAAGALIHLCNGGEVFLPDGSHYYGSESNSVCTGKFMDDFASIGAAGWNDTSVGVIRWFGVLGEGTAQIGGRRVEGVIPVMQSDGSGFFVSPTALADSSLPQDDQSRYVEPLTIPAAVIPDRASLRDHGIVKGTAGVAIRRDGSVAVPFIVGDIGPRIGEGTPALARLLAGLPVDPDLRYEDRFKGIVSDSSVLYVFFSGSVLPSPYSADSLLPRLDQAFAEWGGAERLAACASSGAVPGR